MREEQKVWSFEVWIHMARNPQMVENVCFGEEEESIKPQREQLEDKKGKKGETLEVELSANFFSSVV